METIEALQWLKKNNLYDKAKEASFFLKKIFVPVLGVKDEKLLIIGDKGAKNNRVAAIIAGGYYLAADELKLNSKLIIQDPKQRGADADEDVVTSIANLKEGNIISLSLSDKLGRLGELGKSFRSLCKKKKFKFISASSLGDLNNNHAATVTKCIDIDYGALRAEHKLLSEKFMQAKEVHVTTKAGTDLYYNVDGIVPVNCDGSYQEPGSGGNLPAGEIYMSPNGKNVHGTVVIDGSSRHHKGTTLVKNPITLTIEEGSITKIEGKEEAEQLQRALDWAASKSKHPNTVRRVSEFGIGLNPHASLVGATIIDEKTRGTAHIGIGSNYWFGGKVYSLIHLDQIFKDPVIELDGKRLEY